MQMENMNNKTKVNVRGGGVPFLKQIILISNQFIATVLCFKFEKQISSHYVKDK